MLAFLGPYQYHHHHHHQLRLQVQLVQVKTEKTQQDCGAVTILIATTTCNSLTSFSQKIVSIDKLNLLEVNVTMLIDDRQRYCSGGNYFNLPSCLSCHLFSDSCHHHYLRYHCEYMLMIIVFSRGISKMIITVISLICFSCFSISHSLCHNHSLTTERGLFKRVLFQTRRLYI